MSWAGVLKIAGIAEGTGLVASVLGLAALAVLRRQSIWSQLWVIILSSLGAAGVGAAVAARAMFISPHDIDALLIILAAAGTAGLLVASVLGWRIRLASRSLQATARRIGEGNLSEPARSPGRGSPGELAALGRELDESARRLDEARGREAALEAARRELVAWVSHDLRTPLAAVRAIVEALEDGLVEDPDTVARYIRTLRMETDRLSRLVDDLFELSRIQSGTLRLETERASLGDLVSDAVASESIKAHEKNVRLEARLSGRTPDLEVSPSHLTRVLRNLLENAIRHTPSDGTVWVEMGADRGNAYVAIADQCGGIPELDLPRVFDPAFRGEAARTPLVDGGAGLGLAIARGIVEAHGGAIGVVNEGPGCRFEFRLPLTRQRRAESLPSARISLR
jgi:signal transduction histidine kinase